LERIAHRGAKRELPENTVPAFSRAFERGADAIELDVHATRDGVVVVHHDPDVRLPRGPARPIAAMTWNELQRVELSPGIGVPSLTEVLDVTPPGKTVYVEIKGDRIEPAVIAAVRERPVLCALHSFDHGAIARCRELAPDIPRGILFEKLTTAALVAGLELTGARDVWPRWDLVDAELVASAHAAGARVIAWTVNLVAAAQALVDVGVDGLCTDDVRLLDGLR